MSCSCVYKQLSKNTWTKSFICSECLKNMQSNLEALTVFATYRKAVEAFNDIFYNESKRNKLLKLLDDL